MLPDSAWRLVREPYADLTGTGARLYGGRWNSSGHAMVYLSADAALTILEVRVHLDLPEELLPPDYVLLRADLSTLSQKNNINELIETGPAEKMTLQQSKQYGDRWLYEQRTLLLKVPSVIVPESFNILLNPTHPLASDIAPVSYRPFSFDSRLFS